MEYSQVPAASIDSAFVSQLVDDCVVECATLDYKSQLSLLKGNSDKQDYLKDVCSFANARGGLIVWGVEEVNGVPVKVCGVQRDLVDQTIRQMEQLVISGTEPPITDIKTIALDIGGACVVVQRVARSLIGPHMIGLGGYDRFYIRMSRGNERMDYRGIKRAFLSSEDRIDTLRRERSRLVARIAAGETPVSLAANSLVVLHVLPVMAPEVPLTAAAIRTRASQFMPFWGDCPGSPKINFDGVAFHDGSMREELTSTYCQVFRNGIVESVGPTGYFSDERLPMLDIERLSIDRVTNYLAGLVGLGLTYPFGVAISVIGARGRNIYSGDVNDYAVVRPISEAVMQVPEVVLESNEDAVDRALNAPFDWIWNAGGQTRSPYFDATGRWVGRK